jgi:hypothetical protein
MTSHTSSRQRNDLRESNRMNGQLSLAQTRIFRRRLVSGEPVRSAYSADSGLRVVANEAFRRRNSKLVLVPLQVPHALDIH